MRVFTIVNFSTEFLAICINGVTVFGEFLNPSLLCCRVVTVNLRIAKFCVCACVSGSLICMHAVNLSVSLYSTGARGAR